MLPAQTHQRTDRIQGALIGLALGDAVGAQVEGWSPGAVKSRLGGVTGPDSAREREFLFFRVDSGENPRKVAKSAGMVHPPGLYYHTTQQALLSLERILSGEGLDGAAFAAACGAFARPSRRGKFGLHRKPSPSFRAAIGRVLAGEDWRTAGEPTALDGCLSRAVPVGLAAAPAGRARALLAAELAVVTDRSPLAAMSAAATALLLAALVEDPKPGGAALDAAVAGLQDAEEEVAALLEEEGDVPLEETAKARALFVALGRWLMVGAGKEQDQLALAALASELGRILGAATRPAGGQAPATAVTAAYFALTETRGPAEAILRAVNLGGSAPVLGALTGAFSGALFGRNAFPASWTECLWNRAPILKLGELLARTEGAGSWRGSLRALEEEANTRFREEKEGLRRALLERGRRETAGGQEDLSGTSTA